ncbi:MAG: hypothetical protein ACTSUP_06020 [Candidatus Heimdallarchaeaceae archaeon]
MSMLLDSVFGFPRAPMQRNYSWDFVLPSFGLLVDGIAVSKFCQSCKFGQYSLDEIAIQDGAYKKFFPGILNIETVSATFVTPIPDLVSLYFMNWKKQIVSTDGFYNPSKFYKKNIHIILYSRSGVPSNFIQLNKVFPTKFPAFDLNYNDEKMVEFNVDFKVDKIKMGTEALKEMGSIGKAAGGVVEGAVGAVKGFVGM